jgi:hypothetical protein
MDKKSKILLTVFFLLIIVSVGATFWRIYIKKDYVIQNQIDCDPTINKCFIWECDPASTVEGEACTGDPETDIWYYQIAERNANMIPNCDPNDENCDPWTYEEGEKDCSMTFCDETNKKEQKVECNDPIQYNIDNPVEESDTTCAEGDEECLAAEENATADCDSETEDCPNAATVPDQSTSSNDQLTQTQDNTAE